MKKIKTVIFSFVVVLACQSREIRAQERCNFQPVNNYNTLTVLQCDSLIKANADNPNFAILDVRTPSEYNPQHIEGAINRNLYDSDFNDQLKNLDKEKTYLVHCKSGGRSANAFAQMQNLAFREVYNMQGGINSWKSASLPTTSEFEPKLGIYDCSYVINDTIPQWTNDTITIKITNLANDILEVNSVNISGGSYFRYISENNFNISGAENHNIQIVFSPNGVFSDSSTVTIQSNAGSRDLTVYRTSSDVSLVSEFANGKPRLYPIPANDLIYVSKITPGENRIFEIYNLQGQLLGRGTLNSNYINISNLNSGTYILKINSNEKSFSSKFVKK